MDLIPNPDVSFLLLPFFWGVGGVVVGKLGFLMANIYIKVLMGQTEIQMSRTTLGLTS